MKQNDTVMNLRIATELHDQLKALAKKKYMPVSVMVRLALMDYITHEAPSVLLNPTQPNMAQRKPMTTQEYKFMREQQMRDSTTPMRPQSPSQQLANDELPDWD